MNINTFFTLYNYLVRLCRLRLTRTWLGVRSIKWVPDQLTMIIWTRISVREKVARD